MKRLLILLMLLLPIAVSAQWLNTGNALQRTADGYKYRTNLGSPGFTYWYTLSQVDSAILAHTVSTPYSIMFNNSGSGNSSPVTWNGSSAATISYNTLGAGGLAASNTWSGANSFTNVITVNSSNSFTNGSNAAFNLGSADINGAANAYDFKNYAQTTIYLHLGDGSSSAISYAPRLQVTTAPTVANDVVRLTDLSTYAQLGGVNTFTANNNFTGGLVTLGSSTTTEFNSSVIIEPGSSISYHDITGISPKVYTEENTGGSFLVSTIPSGGHQGFQFDPVLNRLATAGDTSYALTTDLTPYAPITSTVVVLSDSTKFATYTGTATTAVLQDTLVGGGTPFVLLAKGSNSANGVTNFASSNSGYLWYRVYDKSEVNVQWGGAIGDGTTDNTNAIQRCVNTGNIVYFPVGTYLTNVIYYVTGTQLIGQSRTNSIIRQKNNGTTTNGWIIYQNLSDEADLTIKNLTIDGNYQNQSGYFYTINFGTRNFYCDNVSFINTSSAAIKLEQRNHADITHCSFSQMEEHGASAGQTTLAITILANGNDTSRITTIRNNYFKALTPSVTGKSPGGIIISLGTAFSNDPMVICDNVFYGIGQNYLGNFTGSIYEYNNSNISHIICRGNKIYNRKYTGISIFTEYDSDVSDNLVSGVDSASASTAGGAYNLQIGSGTPTMSAFHFSNNTAINQTGADALTIQGYSGYSLNSLSINSFKAINCAIGVLVTYTANASFVDLDVEGATGHAVDISNSTGQIDFIRPFLSTSTVSIYARTGDSGLKLGIYDGHLLGSTLYPVTFETGNTLLMTNNELTTSSANSVDAETIGTVKLIGNYGTTNAPTLNSSTNVFSISNSWTTYVAGGILQMDVNNQKVITTAVTGIVKGAGTGVVSAAVANTDYLPVSSPAMTGTPTAPTPSFSSTATTVVDQAYIPLGASAILSSTSINAKSTGTTALYTVPTGKTLTVTAVYVRCTAASSITSGPAADIGDSGNGAASIYANTTMTALTTSGKIFQYSPGGTYQSVAAGNSVNFNINTVATGTSQTVLVTVLGFLQ